MASVSIANGTFFGNTADNTGGGMLNDSSSPTLYNTVFYENMANGASSDIEGDDLDASSSNNASDDTGGNISSGTGFIDLSADPFINSSDPDGTDNVLGTADDGLIPNCELLTNLGDDSQNMESTDVAGQTRIFDGGIDIGAYERQIEAATTTLYVDVNASGANDGSSFTDAFADLQFAIDVACEGTEIRVAQGTYLPTESPDGVSIDTRDYAFSFK